MSDYQRIADDVRSFVEATDQTNDSATASLAEAYAVACKEVNARLRRCGDLLHRGLRSEALHLAQEQPDLLDAVATLDIPEFAAWEDACSLYGYPRPARMMLDVAAELNDAFGLEEPMQSGLNELRLLALAHAPPLARLRVVRRLRSLDPETRHWTEDAVALERVILNGVRQDVNVALKANDPVIIRRLLDDLTSPDWINRPPKELIDPLVAADLQRLADELNQARAAQNVEGVRKGLAAIQRALAARKLTLPAKHAGTVATASGWLAQQEANAQDQAEFDELCATLKAEIEREAPATHIEALWDRVTAWGLPVADDVLDAYERSKFRRSAVNARATKQYVIIGAVLLGAIVAAVWTIVAHQRDAAAAQQWIAQAQSAIAQYDFDAANKAWSTLAHDSPAIAARDDVKAAHERLEGAEATETKRAQNLEAALADASNETLSHAQRAARIAAAQMYVRLDSERLRVGDLRAKINTENTNP